MYSESILESDLENGSLDIGVFYENEQVWNDQIKFIPLPAHLNFGNVSLSSYYKQQSYTNPITKVVFPGTPITYTITIPNTVGNLENAIVYTKFLKLLESSFSADVGVASSAKDSNIWSMSGGKDGDTRLGSSSTTDRRSSVGSSTSFSSSDSSSSGSILSMSSAAVRRIVGMYVYRDAVKFHGNVSAVPKALRDYFNT